MRSKSRKITYFALFCDFELNEIFKLGYSRRLLCNALGIEIFDELLNHSNCFCEIWDTVKFPISFLNNFFAQFWNGNSENHHKNSVRNKQKRKFEVSLTLRILNFTYISERFRVDLVHSYGTVAFYSDAKRCLAELLPEYAAKRN